RSRNSRCKLAWLDVSRPAKTSAMATRRVGPPRVFRALAAAPVPRPPQPTRAKRMVLSSPACTSGTLTPASADAAATLEVVLIMSRRDRPLVFLLLMKCSLRLRTLRKATDGGPWALRLYHPKYWKRLQAI